MMECNKTLLFRHLPSELTEDERKDFLHHFGANRVRVFGHKKGKMANTAFATFPTKEHATEVLQQLHQVEMLGSTLVVEFARDASKAPSVVDEEGKPSSATLTKGDKNEEKEKDNLKSSEIKFDTTFNTWGVRHPRPPQLKYQYPPPMAVVLTNIMNALASVPAFYVQVLHLMNKMDLPCPFGPLTATPPLHPDTFGLVPTQPDDIDQREMDISSETESELETDDEEKVSRSRDGPQVTKSHRKSIRKPRLKRPRLSDLQGDRLEPVLPTLPSVPVADVFDQIPDPSSHLTKKIELKIPNTVVATSQPKRRRFDEENGSGSNWFTGHPVVPPPLPPPLPEERISVDHSRKKRKRSSSPPPPPLPPSPPPPQETSSLPLQPPPAPSFPLQKLPPQQFQQRQQQRIPPPTLPPVPDAQTTEFDAHQHQQEHIVMDDDGIINESNPNSGFGIIKPLPKDLRKKDEDGDTGEKQWGKSKFASSSELRKGRLSESEMKEMSVFRRYQPGEASCRLYIKNVAKQATEEDLHWLYGRYVHWESESEQNIFDIRLMKEGRMKGQAFVTLPSDEAAKDAVRDTNGFLLMDKPLVVQFARSAKAQDDSAHATSKSSGR